MSPKAKILQLADLRDKLRAEMESLRHKIAGVELSMAVLQSNDTPAEIAVPAKTPKRSGRSAPMRRGRVKQALFEMLKECGDTGLNAATAVELASHKGMTLDRNTLSSLLSRLKHDGVVDHDGDKYRLKPRATPNGNGAHPH